MPDPFSVLGVAEDAGDAEIRRRYLELVREFPPDRALERFQELRAAYEALDDERKRLETRLLHTNTAALTRLSMAALRAGATTGHAGLPACAPARAPARALKQTVTALLMEGIRRVMPDATSKDGGKHGGR